MPITYDDRRVLRPKMTRNLTQEQLNEIFKCQRDIKYFANHYYKVVSDGAESVIKLRGFQERLLDHYVNNTMSIVMSGRQSGKTTTSCIYLLWMAIFNEHCGIAILANKQKNAIEIIDDLKKAYENLPDWMKPGVEEYNATNVEFENGSKIFGAATSENALRGFSADILFCDEFAFVPKNMAEKFWKSNYPIVSGRKNGRIILVSTPCGATGKFYDIWMSANKGDGEYPFKAFKVEWTEVPGRDDTFKQKTIASIGLMGWLAEYECKFEGSSKTLIKGETLERLNKEVRDPIKLEKLSKKIRELIKLQENYFSFWKEPQDKRVYVIGLDVGTGSGSDSSVINVFDVTEFYTNNSYELVATFKRNDINVFEFATMADKVAKQFNNASIICENNGTGLGGIVLNELYMEKGYENVFYDYENQSYGVNANGQTKPLATTQFKEDVEGNICKLYSQPLLDELKIYEENNNKPGKFAAKRGTGNNDDIVSGSYWVSYLLRTKWWDDIKDELYNKVIIHQAKREEEVQDEETLDTFEDLFTSDLSPSIEQQAKEFDKEMWREN